MTTQTPVDEFHASISDVLTELLGLDVELTSAIEDILTNPRTIDIESHQDALSAVRKLSVGLRQLRPDVLRVAQHLKHIRTTETQT